MRPHPFLAALFLLGGLTAAATPAAEAVPSKPNIVFLLTDDQRWDTVAALGNEQCKTPTFDRLVNTGFHFNNAFCQGSMIGAVCLPSRTMIATGRSLWRIPENPRAKEAPQGVPLLPTLVADAGYTTFHCGKSGNACTFSDAAFQTNILQNKRTATTATELADFAIAFLKKQEAGKPFFMYLAPQVPHDPRLAPPQYMKMYSPATTTLPKQFMAEHPFDPGVLEIRDEQLAAYPRKPDEMKRHLAEYYGTISHLDAEFGRVLKALYARPDGKNTIVVFSSDQGLACGGYHALMGKQNLYEDVKPPLVISGPGVPHGQSDALVYLYDLFPTICELAGARTPSVAEGKSLIPIAMGKEAKTREWLFGAYEKVQRMVRDDGWKLIKFDVKGEVHELLFDLKNDPEEMKDLSNDPAQAGRLKKMEAELEELRKEFNDPVDFGHSKAASR